MHNKIVPLIAIISILTFNSCSSIKVLKSWKSENVESIRSKNILVVARTANDVNRKAFEEEIAKQLRAKDLKATESYKKYPKIDPNNKLTEEKIKNIKEMFQTDGYNAVVVSVLKSTEVLSETTVEGGDVTGASLSSYYDMYAIGFYGYYAHPGGYSNYEGVYEEETITTRTGYIYVLETAAYNLDLPEKEQLVAIVTSKIVEPDNVADLADNYAKAIIKGLKNNKNK